MSITMTALWTSMSTTAPWMSTTTTLPWMSTTNSIRLQSIIIFSALRWQARLFSEWRFDARRDFEEGQYRGHDRMSRLTDCITVIQKSSCRLLNALF
ncbi:hypothetical protein BC629DRAFT_146839 [Irpex lacteus]|nr:hypothetical protein BC629DRAFT_146839 [Irpex lacteus]